MAEELSKYTTQELERFSRKLLDLLMDAVRMGTHLAAAKSADVPDPEDIVYEATAREVVSSKDNIHAKLDHEAVRNTAGYYDFTHKLLEVSGMDARNFLNKMFVAPISKMRTGQAKYTTMLNGNGQIIDDVIVFRIKEDTYWVSTLYIRELTAWFEAHQTCEEVQFREITQTTVMYAVQGPASLTILNQLLKEDIKSLGFFQIRDNAVKTASVKVARSGYTGELGYELYFHPKDRDLIETALEQAGAAHGLRKITTDVITTSQ